MVHLHYIIININVLILNYLGQVSYISDAHLKFEVVLMNKIESNNIYRKNSETNHLTWINYDFNHLTVKFQF